MKTISPSTSSSPARPGRQLAGLAGWLAVTALTAVVGSIASMNAGTFYQQLQRPEWAPPASLFGPVWSVLYLMMAIAAWLVWRAEAGPARQRGLVLYAAQLVFNALWSWLFFAWHQGGLAMLDIVLLWVLVAANLVAFWQVRRTAGLLMVPYLAWVSYASLLNLALWQANRQLLG